MHLIAAFRAVVALNPNGMAVVGPDATYTFRQALERIDELSLHLGGRKHESVLIIGPKNCDTVLWQLACNQAGKVFIPCDTATPAARVALVVRRTGPGWIVADVDRDFGDAGYQLVREVGSHRLWHRDNPREYDAHVSHVIFSSGSTGEPKAILLPDAPVVEVVLAQAAQLGVGPGSRLAWLLSPSFDASLSDIYATLLAGATLHVCSFGLNSVKTLQAYFTQHHITHSDLPPSVLHLLDPGDFPFMRAVVFGGELASETAVRAWVAKGKKLFNAYGPTEATICSSLREVDGTWTATNVGRPLPGVEYLLRTATSILSGAPGDRGELVIAGPHLAVGYDSVEMTTQRFIDTGPRRCYLTGDLVEIDGRGEYHFLGRVDRQMKHHGVLLCPEEIEMLAQRAGCSEARIRLQGKRLVLHYSGPITPAELKTALSEALHPSSVPHRYCRFDALPKSITGKTQA
jgi:non-ribosomal peptide synthetase component F